MVFGTNALVTKPAQSLAPMVAVAILNNFGYQQLKPEALSAMDKEITRSADIGTLHSAMFYMCCTVPIVIGFIQIAFWKFYTIRNSHHSIDNVMYVESLPDSQN